MLHLKKGEITDLRVINPFMPGDKITDRSVILDVNVELNHAARIDLEMQVVNNFNWPERSLYYVCRNYLNLVRNEDFDHVAPSWHIGFLDYTLFDSHPSFYATYKLMDTKDHFVYTDKFSIGVVDLTRIDLASAEDRHYNIDKWAKLFKAKTWEDIKMLAKQDVFFSKAGETYFEITADEHERQLAEGREVALLLERGQKRLMKELKSDLKNTSTKLQRAHKRIAEQDKRIAELEALLAQTES